MSHLARDSSKGPSRKQGRARTDARLSGGLPDHHRPLRYEVSDPYGVADIVTDDVRNKVEQCPRRTNGRDKTRAPQLIAISGGGRGLIHAITCNYMQLKTLIAVQHAQSSMQEERLLVSDGDRVPAAIMHSNL
ncbi:hypothetical protein IF1G_05327 [Cordyceps javanica]|uniref:Uncharacterized protein n=1 Tax=Cordyceps javanica TaxID=43265 RepID=A0A545V197_9HYPO|nr:hypothetical protein IF1G_05327 [Cordyceps javanica]